MINTYYLFENGQQIGPFSHHELMDRGVAPDELILSPISNEWQSASDLPEFADYFESVGIYYPTGTNLATFWWRLLAYLIDYVLILLLAVAFGVVIGLALRFTGGSYYWIYDKHNWGLKFSLAIMLICYNSVFEATKMQGSIGKTICKLKVVNAQRGRINFTNALGRNLSKIISSLVCGMGFLNIFWDSKKQGWHDQIAKTYIIRKA